MVLVKLNEKEVNKVFEFYGTKRYLFVNGRRAIVYDHEVEAMKKYLKNKFFLEKQSIIEIGNNIDIASLKQKGEILAVKGKKCIVRLQMLGATMSLNLN